MSVSRVRENRTHGSMRRREATPDQSAKPARSPDASRRPYNSRARTARSDRRQHDRELCGVKPSKAVVSGDAYVARPVHRASTVHQGRRRSS
jgi:hypothetical protein